MQPELIHELRAQRSRIRARWETFLRLEKVTSPLAHPDTLAFGINDSLSEIFSALRRGPVPAPVSRSDCGCGRHPLGAYYLSGQQAVLEALVLAQAARAPLAPAVRDAEFAEVKAAVTALAARDLAALAQVCQLKPPAGVTPSAASPE